jgi:hypothetical protein
MMKLDVVAASFVPGTSRTFQFTVPPEALLGEDAEQFCHDISVSGTVVNTGQAFRVMGSVTTCKEFVCDRCLEKGRRDIAYDFSEDYTKTPGETDEASLFDGESIVIDSLVRDTLLVAEPLRELCEPNCKGLCPVCGQNLNEGQCHCDTFVPDPRLAALESLLAKS